MSLTTIIILSVVVVLIIIGSTQRKKIVLWFRSETHDFLKDVTSSSKVLSLRISDLKVAVKKMIDAAGDLHSDEMTYATQLVYLKKKYEAAKADAKSAKEDDNADLAKTKLTLYLTLKNEYELLEQNLDTIKNAKTVLEVKIARMQNSITEYEVKLKGLKSRESVNEALSRTRSVITSVEGETLDTSLDDLSVKVSAEEFKHEYLSTDEADDTYSAEVDKEFETL